MRSSRRSFRADDGRADRERMTRPLQAHAATHCQCCTPWPNARGPRETSVDLDRGTTLHALQEAGHRGRGMQPEQEMNMRADDSTFENASPLLARDNREVLCEVFCDDHIDRGFALPRRPNDVHEHSMSHGRTIGRARGANRCPATQRGAHLRESPPSPGADVALATSAEPSL